VHIIETLVDTIQLSVMSDIFINLDFSIKVIFAKKKKVNPVSPIEFGTLP